MTDAYAQPQVVDDLTLAFPANLGTLLPPRVDIPTDYPRRDEWMRLAGDWFYGTIPDDVKMNATPGVDAQVAGRHLTAILRSYEPKHEHKEEAVAWLASRWFTHVTSPSDPSYHVGSTDGETHD